MPRQADGWFFHSEQDVEGSPFKAGTLEADTMTCNHCMTVVILKPTRERVRGWCRQCDAYLCDICHEVYGQRGECFTTVRTQDLAMANPGQMITLGRPGEGARIGLPTEAEIKLIDDTRVHALGAPRGDVTMQGGTVPQEHKEQI